MTSYDAKLAGGPALFFALTLSAAVSGCAYGSSGAPEATRATASANLDPLHSAWAATAGAQGQDQAMGVAALADGSVVAAGYFGGTVDFGCGPLVATGTYDAYVAHYASTGGCLWSTQLGGTDMALAMNLAAAADGSIYVGGTFSAHLGDAATGSDSAGGFDGFVAKLDANGGKTWTRAFGGTGDDFVYGLAATAGGVVFAGSIASAVTFGASPTGEPTTVTSHGGSDVALATYAANGVEGWMLAWGGASDDVANGVVVDAHGAITICGKFEDTIDFGGGALASAGDDDAFVATFSSSGAYVSAETFGGTGYDVAYAVGLDASGATIVAGVFTGAATFDGTALTANGPGAGFVSRRGSTPWTVMLDADGGAYPSGIALGSDGAIVVAGRYSGSVDFGGQPSTASGPADAFVTKRGASGENLGTRTWGGDGFDGAQSVAVGPSDRLVIVGYFEQTIDFGFGAVTAAGASDAFVLDTSY